eukprot:TRINITY_DN7896_c0_g1_i2.p1 TRINITY_DN7896_c0_g1~~TRINITY_DN7896_c0_g1_i2.p1  ORF type:complete len:168 (-),score=41.82 TRINITY_DN7896_c0_g1_i2:110-613(-)
MTGKAMSNQANPGSVRYYADIIETPTFLLHSLYDSSELSATLRMGCCLKEGAADWCDWDALSKQCDATAAKDFEALRSEHMSGWKSLASKPGNGVWAPACIVHTMTYEHWTATSWEVPAGSGNTMAHVVQGWLDDKELSGLHVFEDKVSWPANRPCASTSIPADITV